MGESVLALDGRSASSLAMMIRAGSHDPLRNHALAQSSDGGETWTAARLLDIPGTTCQGLQTWAE